MQTIVDAIVGIALSFVMIVGGVFAIFLMIGEATKRQRDKIKDKRRES